jgi:hypothetical protein
MMLGTCAVTLRLLLQLSAGASARVGEDVALERMAQQLRDDVHACREAKLAADTQAPAGSGGLRLALEPDHAVVYAAREGSIVRDESRPGKAIRHESYILPRGRVARFEERAEGTHRLVALVVSRIAGKSRTDPPRPLEVVALPGKHRAGAPEKSGGADR